MQSGLVQYLRLFVIPSDKATPIRSWISACYLPVIRAVELAIEKAKSAGGGIVVTRTTGRYGSVGHHARIGMEEYGIGFSGPSCLG